MEHDTLHTWPYPGRAAAPFGPPVRCSCYSAEQVQVSKAGNKHKFLLQDVNSGGLAQSPVASQLSLHQKLHLDISHVVRDYPHSFTVFVMNRRVFGKWDEATAAASRSWKELQRIIPEKEKSLSLCDISRIIMLSSLFILVHFEG